MSFLAAAKNTHKQMASKHFPFSRRVVREILKIFIESRAKLNSMF